MQLSYYGLFVPLCILVAILISSIKVVREDCRIVMYRLGRYLGIRGPGIVLSLVPIDRCLQIRVGDHVRVISPDRARVGNIEFPIRSSNELAVGEMAVVKGFEVSDIVVQYAQLQMPEITSSPSGLLAKPLQPTNVSIGTSFAFVFGSIGFLAGLIGPTFFGPEYPQVPVVAFIASILGIGLGHYIGARLDRQHPSILVAICWFCFVFVVVVACALFLSSPIMGK